MARSAMQGTVTLLAALLVAACYPGLQRTNTYGAVRGVTVGNLECSGLSPGQWSFPPKRSDHCWAFKKKAEKSVRVLVRSGDEAFDGVVSLWRAVGESRVQRLGLAHVQGSGTTEALEVELPRAEDNTYAIKVTEVSGGSYSVSVK